MTKPRELSAEESRRLIEKSIRVVQNCQKWFLLRWTIRNGTVAQCRLFWLNGEIADTEANAELMEQLEEAIVVKTVALRMIGG